MKKPSGTYGKTREILPIERPCRNRGDGEKCHAELVSASNRIKELRNSEMNSG